MEREVELEGNLDEIIDQLLEYKNKGVDVFYNYNGHVLHSKDLTVDSAYLEVMGETHIEYLKRQRELKEKWNNEDKEFLANKDTNATTWYIEGMNYIYSQKEDKWKKLCISESEDTLYKGGIIKEALRIMRLIANSDNLKEIADAFNNDDSYSGAFADSVESIILYFSKRGPEFVKCLYEGQYLSDEFIKTIEEIENENKSYEEEIKPKNK